MTMPRDLRALLQVVANDIDTFLNNSPEAIPALLFRALRDQVEQVVDVTDQVGALEASEKIIAFADAEDVKVYELPIDWPVMMDDQGEGGSGFTDQPVVMLINAADIPKASVVVYDEYDGLGDTTTRKMLYIERSEPVSKKPGAGMIYFMLPFFDYDERFAS